MKLALITDGIQPYVIGGMQRHSFFIAKYLAQKGVFVDLYHTWGQNSSREEAETLHVFSPDERKFIKSFVIDFPVEPKFPSPWGKGRKWGIPGHYLRSNYLYSERIYDVLLKNIHGVDFIYAKGFSAWKLLEEKGKGKNFPPLGIKFHGLNMFQKAPSYRGILEQWMFRPPVRFNLKQADFVFSYGGKISCITRQIGIPREKIIEIPTGIEAGWIRDYSACSAGEPLKFLYAGRYERLKGIKEISKAILNLKRQKASFEFHFVGPIPTQHRLNFPEVIYHGQLNSSSEIQRIYDFCDFLVLPSYSEGMPNVIIEAMARGLAIIATDVGAVNCLVSPENGFLLEGCSVKNIENAMARAISLSKEKLMEMKRNSIEKIQKNFLWEDIGGRLIAEISRIISSTTPP